LCKIPKYQRKEVVIDLLESCTILANKQELAIQSIEECIVELDYTKAMNRIAFAKKNRLISKEKSKDLRQKCNRELEVISKKEKISVLKILFKIIISLVLLSIVSFAVVLALETMVDPLNQMNVGGVEVRDDIEEIERMILSLIWLFLGGHLAFNYVWPGTDE
jgi:hypothetical protein